MKIEIGFILIFIALSFSILYGIDRFTAENPSNAALLRIGLSSIDSSTCKICEEGGMYYESGCKRCMQDGVVVSAHVSNEKFYTIGWSNDDAMYHGDSNCDGSKSIKNVTTNENETYYIQISKNNLLFETNFYNDKDFSDIKESTSFEMCSNPTNLQYVRITNEDGKPPANGGKLYGYIDDIKIWKNIDEQTTPTFSTSFNECVDKTCGNIWTLHNPNRIFVNPEINSLSFFSEVLGTHDYAHLKLDEELPDSWIMRFILHIDNLEEHPRGKGILNTDPSLLQIVFGIPALVLPFIGFGITRTIKSNSFGITMIIIGFLILSGIMFYQYQTNSLIDFSDNWEWKTYQNIGILGISILIIILGISKMELRKKGNMNEIND